MDQAEHNATHDSVAAPVSGCEWCQHEIVRRTMRCFGDGSSTVPVPQVIEDE